jgi:signal transduction histidine kinase
MATDRAHDPHKPRARGIATAQAGDPTDGLGADERVEFMDLAAHEMRSPLTALMGTAQILQRRLRHDPARAADLTDVNRLLFHAARLANLVDIFLAATHLAQQRFEVIPTECDVIACARRVTVLFASASRDRTITFEADADELEIKADRKRLEELLTILLNNAIKYGGQGDIAVRVRHTLSTVRVTVADHGIGVPTGERRRIFEPYVRGSNAPANSIGLGLYVARAIVRRHDGKIGVRANAGGGSIFWFEVPLGL